MTFQSNGTDLSFAAGADLSHSQFLALTIDTDARVIVAGTGTVVVGVLQNNPKINQAATVRVYGVTKMICAGNIANGATVSADATGKAVTGGAALGIAQEGGVAGDFIPVLLTHTGASPA
jgi:hypothetical protein